MLPFHNPRYDTTTTGVYSQQTLTLAQGVVVKDFHFGCGHDKRRVPGKYDGLLGLGRLPESLAVKYGGAFSYCLPAFQFTPMGGIPTDPTFYTVTLTGITVGGKRLNIPPQAFRGGMIVDSSSVVMGLSSTDRRSEVSWRSTRCFRMVALTPATTLQVTKISSCRRFPSYSVVAPQWTSFFFARGATIDLDVSNGIMLDGCLAFAMSGPDDNPGLLGNVNQRTFEVLFVIPYFSKAKEKEKNKNKINK
ncbi:hypothetical protein EJB05_45096, partial [Eragrostis curvula]